MKKTISLSLLALGLVAFLSAFSFQNGPIESEKNINSSESKVEDFPEDVAKILKVHCMDCHVTASKNDKAKDKLNFDKWDKLNMMKKTGKLNDIIETVSEGKMPPEKYLNHYPDKKLTEDQVKVITKWAQGTMDSFKE